MELHDFAKDSLSLIQLFPDKPLVIGLLTSISPNAEDDFVEASKVYDYLQVLGFTPEQIDAAIIRGYDKKLLETDARRIPQPGQVMPQTLRATTVGNYHINRLCHQFSYVDAIIVDTPIFDPHVRSLMRDVHSIEQRLERAEIFRQYLDDQWSKISNKTAKTYFSWNKASNNLKKEMVFIT